MNYVCVVLGIFGILLVGIWVGNRNEYRGPVFAVILGTDVPQSEEMVISGEKNRSEKSTRE